MPKTHKLYCYVDETGQDTKGRFYIVVVVVSFTEREEFMRSLELAEDESGKGKLQWSKSSTLKRDRYIEMTL